MTSSIENLNEVITHGEQQCMCVLHYLLRGDKEEVDHCVDTLEEKMGKPLGTDTLVYL